MNQDSPASCPDAQWRKLPAWFTQLVDRHIARLENQASVPHRPEAASTTSHKKGDTQ